MSGAYEIRMARAEDIQAILALDREMENVPHWRAADYIVALPSAHLGALVSGTGRCLYVADRGSVVVGFAVGKIAYTGKEATTTAELESLGVAERARRCGIGMALCVAVIEWARDMGATEIQLEVRSRSTGPISLYEKLGFAAMGRRANYYREPVDDAILMRLNVAFDPTRNVTHDRDL